MARKRQHRAAVTTLTAERTVRLIRLVHFLAKQPRRREELCQLLNVDVRISIATSTCSALWASARR